MFVPDKYRGERGPTLKTTDSWPALRKCRTWHTSWLKGPAHITKSVSEVFEVLDRVAEVETLTLEAQLGGIDFNRHRYRKRKIGQMKGTVVRGGS